MITSKSLTLPLTLSLAAGVLAVATLAAGQGPAPAPVAPAGTQAAPAPGGGGRGGRGGLPGATPAQTQAVADMNGVLAPLNTALAAARTELTGATFAVVKNEATIRAAVDKLLAAELAVALKRAEEFAKLQASANKLTPEQVTALAAAANQGGGRGFGGGN